MSVIAQKLMSASGSGKNTVAPDVIQRGTATFTGSSGASFRSATFSGVNVGSSYSTKVILITGVMVAANTIPIGTVSIGGQSCQLIADLTSDPWQRAAIAALSGYSGSSTADITVSLQSTSGTFNGFFTNLRIDVYETDAGLVDAESDTDSVGESITMVTTANVQELTNAAVFFCVTFSATQGSISLVSDFNEDFNYHSTIQSRRIGGDALINNGQELFVTAGDVNFSSMATVTLYKFQ